MQPSAIKTTHDLDAGIDPCVLPLLEFLDGVACVIRDESMRVTWCNAAYIRISQQPVERVMGSRMDEFIPPEAAEERESLFRRVIEAHASERFYQFGVGQRLLCSAHPLDADAFGHRGVLAMIQPAANGGALGTHEGASRVLSTPCLDELSPLSSAELRVLHHLSLGLATAEIGEKLHRSAKTVEKQIESLHRKLGTRSRAELVRFATERGVQSFDDDAWESIIRGATKVRRTARRGAVGTGR